MFCIFFSTVQYDDQGYRRNNIFKITTQTNKLHWCFVFFFPLYHTTVSYTHLDVYKRQRWLSLLPVVSRLLEQLSALILFFTSAVKEDKLLAAEHILVKLRDPVTRLYLEFLEFVLPVFVGLNRKMQSEGIKIHLLYDRISALYKQVLQCYTKQDYLEHLSLIHI